MAIDDKPAVVTATEAAPEKAREAYGGEGHTIVCGLERLGLRTTEELRGLGEEVTVLVSAPDRTFADHARTAGAVVQEGSSQEEDDLIAAGVKTARCLVLTEDSDLGNLHAALLAQEMNPGLRVVIRIFNSELARRASALLTDIDVLSLSALSAPTLAAEALGEKSGDTVMIWGRRVVLREEPSEEAAVLAALDEKVLLEDAGEALEGDREDWERSRRVRVVIQGLRTFFDRRLAAVLVVVALLATISALVFSRFAGFTLIDAIYFTFTTVTTVGYGDLNLVSSPDLLKLYDVGLMLFGALSLAALYALVTDAIVGARLAAALGVPHGKIKNHVVVCGLGNVGFRTVEHLVYHKIKVAAVDLSDRGRFVQLLRHMGVPVLTGDALLPDNLRLLCVDKARAVIATTNDDVTNLEMMIASRELNHGVRLVARVFDAKLAERAEKRFEIHACRSVSALSAPFFAGSALGSDVNTVIRRGGQVWLLAEATVAKGSKADGMRVSELEAGGHIHLIAVRDSATASWKPEQERVLAAGHEILVVAHRDGLLRLREVTRAHS
ncbi:MAG: NAD-binding protein [Candidatus Dormiibacterota bacterium]